MKILVYTPKGGVGKTPIAVNISKEKDILIATNEKYHIYDHIMSDEQFLFVDMNESFPNFGNHDVIFDLAGSIGANSQSIKSAISMSDIVIVPTTFEFKSMIAGISIIPQFLKINKNIKIIVIVTKIRKHKSDNFVGNNWDKSKDFVDVKSIFKDKLPDIAMSFLPLKESKVFDNIFENGSSIQELIKNSGLAAYSYKDVALQFKDIYKKIGI